MHPAAFFKHVFLIRRLELHIPKGAMVNGLTRHCGAFRNQWIRRPAASFLYQLDTLADAGILMKDIVEIDPDLVCVDIRRDDEIDQCDTLAHIGAINLPHFVLSSDFNLKTTINIKLHPAAP
jgi:hypothetical protein